MQSQVAWSLDKWQDATQGGDMAGAATKRELVDQIMGGELAAYVAARRTGETRRSWSRIAADIRADHSIDVSYESLRLWFPEYGETASDKAVS